MDNKSALQQCLNYSNMLPRIFCSCKLGLKQYSCIYTTGLMMFCGFRTISQLIGKINVKGRRNKVKHALSKNWLVVHLYPMYLYYILINNKYNISNMSLCHTGSCLFLNKYKLSQWKMPMKKNENERVHQNVERFIFYEEHLL